MQLSQGDIRDALAKFEAAHQRAPHFADALKGWGDALVRQGRSRVALARFNEALRDAPHWKELKEAREAAAKQKN